MTQHWLLPNILSSGFVVSIVVMFLWRRLPTAMAMISVLFPWTIFGLLVGPLNPLQLGAAPEFSVEWFQQLDVHFKLRLDTLSWVFSLLIAGIGGCIAIYARSYFHDERARLRFWPGFLVFLTSMLGVVWADNFIVLFVFWELTSLSSYWLITFYAERESVRSAGLQALLVTGLGGLALLGAAVMLSFVTESFDISRAIELKQFIRIHKLYEPILILFLVGAFTKSAQFPFHFWLPGAMVAPTPVSAFLHSATLVKAGIYLLLRLNPLFSGAPSWQTTLLVVGAITFAWGAFRAFLQKDLKMILAYTTISGLGCLVMLIGYGSSMAIVAAILFLVTHALYKAGMFLISGIIEHETGTRNLRDLGGLRKRLPWTAALCALGVLSMAGLPPTLGFLSKELIYDVAQGQNLFFIMIVGNALIGAVGLSLLIGPFFGKPSVYSAMAKHIHEPSWWMRVPPLILVFLGVLFGLKSSHLQMVVEKILGEMNVDAVASLDFSLWHGWNWAFYGSLITWVLAIGFYLSRKTWPQQLSRLPSLEGDQAFRGFLRGVLRYGEWQTQSLQDGRLRHYLLIILITTIWVVVLSLVNTPLDLRGEVQSLGPAPATIAAFGLILLGVVFVLSSRTNIFAILSLGIIGWGVSLLFTIGGAPDLAMTQLAVEALSTLLFVLVVRGIPPIQSISPFSTRFRDVGIASGFGVIMATLTWVAMNEQVPSRLTSFFANNSLVQAQGHNIVNVILVDFRGIDTLGEITVLGISAIGVTALLAGRAAINNKEKRGVG